MKVDLISVKEYAAQQGMTEQAAYKQIRAGKLQIVEMQENGKTKKMILSTIEENPGQGAAPADPSPPQPDPGQAAPDLPITAALENAIAVLTSQLEEKDRQISRLTELLDQSQKLQLHSQLLLEQATPQAQEDPQTEEVTPEPPGSAQPKEGQKKRGFWSWLFE